MPPHSTTQFISRWSQASGAERANYQLFLTELCETLELPRPEPASADTAENAYVFERRVVFPHADGTQSHGFIDLYKRGCFVLEAKQTGKELGSDTWGNAMLRAHGQAQQYARALPAAEGRPPFVIVTDVGRTIELYSEFTRSGAAYVPFPDPRSHRIPLEDLAREDRQQTLRAVWTDPLNLDPARRSARVTKAIAADLAKLAEGLEKSGYDADSVASFLMRCLFTMFAEDVELLPKRSFLGLLEESMNDPAMFAHLVPGLWKTMNQGGFSPEIRNDVLRFNGGLFAEQRALPLTKDQIALLLAAARANWRDVEPAIFGTLLERALDPLERHKLGAHYTPRAYVERLVMPTVIEPLREEWTAVQAAAFTLERQGKTGAAVEEVIEFQRRLSSVRVLDPACGSGNFLYVTLEHLKRLEGEVFNTLEELGETQVLIDLVGVTVDPHQMLGLESNPRAARIAETVLWIGYLQWHFRTRKDPNVPEPVLKDYHNIECRDAVLAWDRVEYVTDEQGKPVTRWDGRTTKPHPVTGEEVPDENAQVFEERYIKPRKAVWPKADFVVGNPPFIGNKRMRLALGNGYVQALREIYSDVPGSADYVMYWWHRAAIMARESEIQRFGLITTNSVPQSFNRKVVEHHLDAKKPLSLAFAIPDHPWVDSADGAAVRIAMTVGRLGHFRGVLNTVTAERGGEDEDVDVDLNPEIGRIFSNLRVGPDVGGAIPLQANEGLCWQGCKLVGGHFQIAPERFTEFVRVSPESKPLLKRYWAGSDITRTPDVRYVIDTFGFSLQELTRDAPVLYQHLKDYVLPERIQNRDKAFREKWWLFGRSRPEMRAANSTLGGYIVTSEVSKHRFFIFLRWPEDLIDGSVTSVSLDDWLHLGVLSSRGGIL